MLHLPSKVFRLKEFMNSLGELRNPGIVSSAEVHTETMAVILNLAPWFGKKNLGPD